MKPFTMLKTIILAATIMFTACTSLNYKKEEKMTLEELEAIKQLKATYSAACDDHYNPDRVEELFTEDAVWDGGERFGKHTGHKQIKEFFISVSKSLVFGAHFFVQPMVTLIIPTTA